MFQSLLSNTSQALTLPWREFLLKNLKQKVRSQKLWQNKSSKGMCGKPAHFSLTSYMTAIGIVDSATKMDSFSSLNSVIWNHNSKHCLFQHNLKRRFQLHNYQHRVSLLHGAREHIKFQTWSSHSVHCGVLTAQLKFEVRCSKWRRRYTPCKSNDLDIQKWTTNKACICSFYCHIVKKKHIFLAGPYVKIFMAC